MGEAVNAPARIAPARERYVPIVTHHMPGCAGKELDLRCSLLLMGDKARSHLRHCSDEAQPILEHISRLAALYAYQTMPVEELEMLRYQMLRLTASASDLEQFAWRLANPGGTDARG